MTEILTESFCERCGTRYTFESAAPRRSRVGRVRVLSKGLRNFVLSDETTFSEAMADARSEEELAATASQLDAFHKTFNFCMSCRQYTCASCWNDAEGRCLSCAPHLGHEILQAPFAEPGARAPGVPAMAGSAAGVAPAPMGLDEADAASAEAWPELDVDPGRLARAMGEPAAEPAASEARADAVAWPESDDLTPEPAEPVPAPVEILASDAAADLAALGAVDEAVAAEAPALETVDPDHGEAAGLLGLEPGQSLDDAIAAYEAAAEAAEAEPEPIAAVAEPELAAVEAAAVEAVAVEAEVAPVEAEPEPEPIAAVAEPELAAAVAEPEIAAVEAAAVEAEVAPVEAEPEPEPVAAVAEPEIAAVEAEADVEAESPAPREDVIAQPVWTAPEPEAPDATTPPPSAPQPGTTPIAPTSGWLAVAPESPVADGATPAAPQWPARQSWGQAASARPEAPRTLAGRPLLPTEPSGLWAASNREVLAQAPAAAAGPQPCVSCGLSLSANARFCRRCGARQG